MTKWETTEWEDLLEEVKEHCPGKELFIDNNRLGILAADRELKSCRDRIKELEEALMDVSVDPGKDPCWCIDFDNPEHDEGCQKARKALGIETRSA